jgi:hypothetical protein
MSRGYPVAARHHDHAGRHHREAAKAHEAGDHVKVAHHAHTARGHHEHASHHAAEAAKSNVEHITATNGLWVLMPASRGPARLVTHLPITSGPFSSGPVRHAELAARSRGRSRGPSGPRD